MCQILSIILVSLAFKNFYTIFQKNFNVLTLHNVMWYYRTSQVKSKTPFSLHLEYE